MSKVAPVTALLVIRWTASATQRCMTVRELLDSPPDAPPDAELLAFKAGLARQQDDPTARRGEHAVQLIQHRSALEQVHHTGDVSPGSAPVMVRPRRRRAGSG
jgi:hypothetical protein